MHVLHFKYGIRVLLLSLSEFILKKEVVFPDISYPNRSASKMIDLIRPVDEWTEIAFSPR